MLGCKGLRACNIIFYGKSNGYPYLNKRCVLKISSSLLLFLLTDFCERFNFLSLILRDSGCFVFSFESLRGNLVHGRPELADYVWLLTAVFRRVLFGLIRGLGLSSYWGLSFSFLSYFISPHTPLHFITELKNNHFSPLFIEVYLLPLPVRCSVALSLVSWFKCFFGLKVFNSRKNLKPMICLLMNL